MLYVLGIHFPNSCMEMVVRDPIVENNGATVKAMKVGNFAGWGSYNEPIYTKCDPTEVITGASWLLTEYKGKL